MGGYKKVLKGALYVVYLLAVILIAVSVALPYIVTWYVESRGRDGTLPATIMLTCYPCLPFAAAILISLRRLIRNALSGLIIGDKNITLLNVTVISCFAVTAITAGAGWQYLPFYIIALSSAACGLTFFIMRDLLCALLDKQREEDYKDIEGSL